MNTVCNLHGPAVLGEALEKAGWDEDPMQIWQDFEDEQNRMLGDAEGESGEGGSNEGSSEG